MSGRLSLTTSEPPLEGRIGQSSADLSSLEAPEEGAEAAQSPELAAGMTESQWVDLAQRCYSSSKNWFETSVQSAVARNYAHFQSRHAPGSKYLHDYYRLRSQIFRPKTRAMVRRSEAALAVALFSTSDLLDVDAWDDTNPDQKDGAEVAKAILQYRFERSIPWFQTMVGAQQEAAIHNRPIAHIHWKYRRRKRKALKENEDGKVDWIDEHDVLEDRPWIDLVPLENLRIDPAADWRDPINTSPYVFHRIPMFVGDVKEMAEHANVEYGGGWYRNLDDQTWWNHARRETDAIRAARQAGQTDPTSDQRGVPDAELVWITRCYFRRGGVDYTWDMLDTDVMLSVPRSVEEVLPHLDPGMRPYVMGCTAIEAFKVYGTSPVGMVEESQREINETVNIQQDGMRMAVLNRWIARRGANLDLETLKYGAANSVIVVDDVNQDVKELRSQEVPPSAFASLDRVNNSFDEVAGNFSMASVANNRQMNETVGGMNLLSGDAAQVKEYEIRTFVETFVEPIINQVYALEQMYETDEDLLRDVAVRTGLDIERVVDLLAMRIRVRVNVGFNSTSPERRIQRIALCVSTVTQLAPESQRGINTGEIVKEVFGAAGFKNGGRFYSDPQGQQDPEKQQLMEENAQLKQMLEGRTIEAKSRIEVANINAQARLKQALMDGQSRERIASLQGSIRAKEIQLEAIDRQLAAGAQEIDKLRLANERDALSSDIQEKRVRLMSELLGMTGGGAPGAKGGAGKPAAQVPQHEGPLDLPGHDNAGTLARGRYGEIPFAQG